MLQALIDRSQENVIGTVRLKLFKGAVQVVGRQSPRTLYSHASPPSRRTRSTTSATPRASSSLNALRLRIGALAGELEEGRSAARGPGGAGCARLPLTGAIPSARSSWSRRMLVARIALAMDGGQYLVA